MINKIEWIPVSETSWPFASAEKCCPGFAESGYTETEYYMYGTANVYKTGAKGNPEVKVANAPYVNKFLMRAPKDPAKFSGNVMVEMINATSGQDIERMWILGYKQLMREGDIFIGLTSKPNTFAALREFNAGRYAKLSWPNPTRDEAYPYTKEQILASGDPHSRLFLDDIDFSSEWGLVWDMLTDLAHLLRRGDECLNPVFRFGKDVKIVLAGWSQSAVYLGTYLNQFINHMDENVYDGYLAAGGIYTSFNIALNQYEFTEPFDSRKVRFSKCRVPLMSIQSESDAAAMGYHLIKRNDSDSPDFLYRNYDFAGGSHDTVDCLVQYYLGDPETVRAGKTIRMPPAYNGTHSYGNDYPYEFLFGAAYRNLFYWVRTGVAPVSCENLETDADGNILRDGFGNSAGGVRTCFMDYPTAHYCCEDKIGRNKEPFIRNSIGAGLSAFGYTEPLSASLLRELYGNLENYRKLCEEHTKRMITKGVIVKEDLDDVVELAVRTAVKRGLTP